LLRQSRSQKEENETADEKTFCHRHSPLAFSLLYCGGRGNYNGFILNDAPTVIPSRLEAAIW
jgi:hypothetical protein